MTTGNGEWGRQAYYNAEDQVSEGLGFLNNKGGQSSGTFDQYVDRFAMDIEILMLYQDVGQFLVLRKGRRLQWC